MADRFGLNKNQIKGYMIPWFYACGCVISFMVIFYVYQNNDICSITTAPEFMKLYPPNFYYYKSLSDYDFAQSQICWLVTVLSVGNIIMIIATIYVLALSTIRLIKKDKLIFCPRCLLVPVVGIGFGIHDIFRYIPDGYSLYTPTLKKSVYANGSILLVQICCMYILVFLFIDQVFAYFNKNKIRVP